MAARVTNRHGQMKPSCSASVSGSGLGSVVGRRHAFHLATCRLQARPSMMNWRRIGSQPPVACTSLIMAQAPISFYSYKPGTTLTAVRPATDRHSSLAAV